MTLLVASIAPETLDELHSQAERAWAGGAEAVELRVDTFAQPPEKLATYLEAHRNRTWIVTCRGTQEGGKSTANVRERVSMLSAAAANTCAYVDFEFAEWRRSSDARKVILQATADPVRTEHRLILSAHSLAGVPENLSELVGEIRSVDEAPCAKVAYRADDICDTFAALDLAREHGTLLSAIAMGEDGSWTRVLAKKLGMFATYCALDPESVTAPGQLTLDEMINLYRWPVIDRSTRVFGVMGDPVAHSMSPLLFNQWFADAGINAVYLPLRVRHGGDSVKRFLDGCRRRAWLDIGGFSVTVPHKTHALQWVGKGADSMTRWIGAVNTLVFRGKDVAGHNTDCYAAISSIADALECSRSDLAGMSVDLLGTGGASYAVAHGLYELGSHLTVYGRSREKTLLIANKCGARAAPWQDRAQRDGDVLINCTTVGMWPEVDASPIPADALYGCRLVFDLVYNPPTTRLLTDAAVAGARALSGLDMFVRQAAMQFKLWTGTTPDTQNARNLIACELERRTKMP